MMISRGSYLALLLAAALIGLSAHTATAAPGNALALEQGKGDLVRLPAPADGVFVANPDVANVQVKSPRLLYVFGKNAGETTLFAVDADDRVMLRRTVEVTHNLTALRSGIAALGLKGDVSVRTADESLVVDGRVQSGEAAAEVHRLAERFVSDEASLIDRVTVAGPTQVNLRVRVAEVARDITKNLGIDWNAALSTGNFAFGLTKGNLVPNPDAFSGSLDFSGGDLNVSTLVDILAEEGLVTLLAEPNLTAMSGESASFLAGGEFPVPVPGGDNGTTFEFENFGVSLNFTPTILGEDRISLKVAPEVSELDFANGVTTQGFTIPAKTTRRASTTVELGSGQSFAIAGLLQKTSNQTITKLPGIGDVPVLGALFRSNEFQQGQTELVIIVTPYIVEPSSTGQTAAPTDGLRPPNDVDRLLLGRSLAPDDDESSAAEAALRERELSGQAGFMLE